jgi:hypothetical protein
MTACGKLVTGYNSPDRADSTQEHWIELRTGYPCSVEVEQTGGHDGPCAAVEQPQTISARSRWMEAETRRSADLRHLQSGLGEHQARPQTFAEGSSADPPRHHPSQNVECPICGSFYLAKDLSDHLRQTHGSTATTAPPRLAPVPDPPPVPVPTRANRKHDQQLPTSSDRPVMHEVLINLIESRLAVGVERYGHGLQPMNGRDAYRDLVEELVDACVYTLQIQHERAEMYNHVQYIEEYLMELNLKSDALTEMRSRIGMLVKWLEPNTKK